MIEGQPAKIEDLNIILAATEAANAAKVAATEKAEEVAARLAEMVAAIPTKVSELENDSGYLQQETDPTVPAWAKAQTKPTYTAQEVGALPDNTFIPSKVSDLTDDSGHYVKPASGIPASDLEETYVKFNNYATTSTAGVVKVGGLGIKIRDGEIQLSPASDRQIKTNSGDNSPIVAAKGNQVAFYGLANAAGDTTQSQSSNSIGQYTDAAKAAIQQMLDVPSTADIPTNISDLANDAGYLTEHQDISGKANIADLATVATSGDYDDLLNKPTIPEVPVQDVQINGNSILENRIANIQTTSTIIQNSEMLITSGGVNQALNAILSVNSDQIKAGMNSKRPISPNKQHESTFYGLAKAAGDTTQSQSNNAVGTYTDDAKTAIQAMLDVPSNAAMITAIGNAIGNINSFDMAVVQELPTQDISTHTIYLVPKTGETNDVYDEYVYINSAWEMVGNTQIDLSNYVQKTDYASSSAAGIVRVAEQYGVSMVANSRITIAKATDDNIKAGINEYKAIVPNNQHKSVFYGLTKAAGVDMSSSENAVGTYTTEAKAAIRSMIGAAASADLTVQDVQVNGSSVLSNGIANVPMIANNGQLGLIAYNPAMSETGLQLGQNLVGNNYLKLFSAPDALIKSANDNYVLPVIIANQHKSVFYGLAKAAGDTTQSQSNKAVGTYTNEAKVAIQNMLDVPSTIELSTKIDKENFNNAGIFERSFVTIENGEFTTTTTENSRGEYIEDITTNKIDLSAYQYYKVTFDNVEYELYSQIIITEQEWKESQFISLGNHSLLADINKNLLLKYNYTTPFCIIDSGSQQLIFTQTAGTHTIKIEIENRQINLIPRELLHNGMDEYYQVGAMGASFSIGFNSFLNTAINSVGIGIVNNITAKNSVAIGVRNTVSGESGTAIGGWKNTASGAYSFTSGMMNEAQGSSSIALGQLNIASGRASIALGWNSIANHRAQLVFGTCNIEDSSEAISAQVGNYIEIVGNGINTSARSNAYALDWSGNGHYMGDVYVGANADSTGGTKVLCEADFATAQDIQNIINGGAGA